MPFSIPDEYLADCTETPYGQQCEKHRKPPYASSNFEVPVDCSGSPQLCLLARNGLLQGIRNNSAEGTEDFVLVGEWCGSFSEKIRRVFVKNSNLDDDQKGQLVSELMTSLEALADELFGYARDQNFGCRVEELKIGNQASVLISSPEFFFEPEWVLGVSASYLARLPDDDDLVMAKDMIEEDIEDTIARVLIKLEELVIDF